MIKYNVGIVNECTQMIAACEALTAEVHSDAMALRARVEENFQGGGGQAFQEDYMRVLTYIDGLREKIQAAKTALAQGLDHVVGADASLRGQYAGA